MLVDIGVACVAFGLFAITLESTGVAVTFFGLAALAIRCAV
jgi:hypothetical protein